MNETSYDIVTEALKLEKPSRTPVVPIVGLYSMNFSRLSSAELLHDGKKQAKSQLLCQSKFGYDGVFNVMDLSVEAQTLGAEVEFPSKSFPYVKTHPLNDPIMFEELPSLDVRSTRLSVFTDCINFLAQEIKKEVYISSYVIGPFTLAGHLLGIDKLMELTIEEEALTTALVEHCARIVEPYIESQVEAGTDNIVILEPSSSSSLISPKFFKMFSFQSVKILISKIKRLGVGATLHICGKTSEILEMMSDTGADVISIDAYVTISEAMEKIKDQACLMGNVDTSLMITGTPSDVSLAANTCVTMAGENTGYILSTSCDTPIEVPAENMAALVSLRNLDR